MDEIVNKTLLYIYNNNITRFSETNFSVAFDFHTKDPHSTPDMKNLQTFLLKLYNDSNFFSDEYIHLVCVSTRFR